MKLNKNSYTSIASVIQDALKKYASMENRSVVTDIYLQPDMQSGELSVFNDDDELLASLVIDEWMNVNPEEFQSGCELDLKKVLNQLSSDGAFASFVMVDAEKEILAELMIVDDEETMFLNDELLKGLDDELNAFLKDLLDK